MRTSSRLSFCVISSAHLHRSLIRRSGMEAVAAAAAAAPTHQIKNEQLSVMKHCYTLLRHFPAFGLMHQITQIM